MNTIIGVVLGALLGVLATIAAAFGWVRAAGRGAQATEQYPGPPRRRRAGAEPGSGPRARADNVAPRGTGRRQSVLNGMKPGSHS